MPKITKTGRSAHGRARKLGRLGKVTRTNPKVHVGRGGSAHNRKYGGQGKK